MPVRPFTVHVPDATLADLRERLGRTRWLGELDGPGWQDGTSPAFMRELLERPPSTATRTSASPAGVEPRPLDPGEQIRVPAAVALFDYQAPRKWVERAYADLRRFTQMGRGGHFAAMEEPELLAEDLRAFFRYLR
jgi:hypothetical protein